MNVNVLSSTRLQCDVTKLLIAGYELELNDDCSNDFFVTFHGPKGTAYEHGVWRVHVVLPKDYPFVSPSIGFTNKILHPNIDEASGTVCLDVINQTWTPLYSLVNVFDIFLPQLLAYPNAMDPLNAKAGRLLLHNKDEYENRIRDYVNSHASYETYLQEKEARKVNIMSLKSSKSDALEAQPSRVDNTPPTEVDPTTSSFTTSESRSMRNDPSKTATSSPPKEADTTSVSKTPQRHNFQVVLCEEQEPTTPLSDVSMTDVVAPDGENLLKDEMRSSNFFLSW